MSKMNYYLSDERLLNTVQETSLIYNLEFFYVSKHVLKDQILQWSVISYHFYTLCLR